MCIDGHLGCFYVLAVVSSAAVNSGVHVSFWIRVLSGLCPGNGASQVALVVKNLPVNTGDVRDSSSIPGSRRIPWRRAWQPVPVFLPGESHGQRT